MRLEVTSKNYESHYKPKQGRKREQPPSITERMHDGNTMSSISLGSMIQNGSIRE